MDSKEFSRKTSVFLVFYQEFLGSFFEGSSEMSLDLKAVPNSTELAAFYRRIFLWGFPKERNLARGIYIPVSAGTYTGKAEDLEIPGSALRYSISLNLSDRTSVGIAYAFVGADGWVVSAFHEDCSFSRHYGQKSNGPLISDIQLGLGANSSIAKLAFEIFETCFPSSDQHGGYGMGVVRHHESLATIGKRTSGSLMHRLENVHLQEEKRFFSS